MLNYYLTKGLSSLLGGTKRVGGSGDGSERQGVSAMHSCSPTATAMIACALWRVARCGVGLRWLWGGEDSAKTCPWYSMVRRDDGLW
eukprot:351352-Chlamydomonas_euryale.AAC.3